jgi:pimeloyl-ACP methyl ester carboxylesterase
MRDNCNAETYNFLDHAVSRAVRWLSPIIGVKNLVRPFLNRWRASLIGDAFIDMLISSIGSIDRWGLDALKFIRTEEMKLMENKDHLTSEESIVVLRRLSYLCHIGQWGVLPITEVKTSLYQYSRDYYIEAEKLAQGRFYQRIPIPWNGKKCWGNLHLPREGEPPFPLIVMLHGLDDTKEEHLRSELYLQECGFAVFCFDGPGQGESLYMEHLMWPPNFHESCMRAIDIASQYDCDVGRVGVMGISWGGMWAIKTTAYDQRVKAVYDLGGPIDARQFSKLPFFLKTRVCQAVGITEMRRFSDLVAEFAIRELELLKKVCCPVRIVHGGKDPLVPIKDKEWLRDTLKSLHPDQEVTLVIHPTGDHCCTPQALEIRRDAAEFFGRHLGPAENDLSLSSNL